jgi:hypothetical protein
MEWRESINSRLEAALPRARFQGRERLRWLSAHLCEYIDRWIGFVDHPVMDSASPDRLIGDPLFGVIGVGIELLGEELALLSVPSPLTQLWEAVCETHRRILQDRDVNLRYMFFSRCKEFTTSL